MHEKIQRMLSQLEANSRAVKFLNSRKGSVGFGDDVVPVAQKMITVVGKEITIQTREGPKSFVPKASVVLMKDGNLEFVEGGLNDPVTIEDAKRLLAGLEEKKKLELALRKNLRRKKSRIVIYG